MGFKSDGIYLVQTYAKVDSDFVQIEVCNHIARGINACAEEDYEDLWGYVSWFDTANQQSHTIMIKDKPTIQERNVTVIEIDSDIQYRFIYVTKKVYDESVRILLNQSLEVKNDNEAQSYLKESL